jgi:hypothetical protein
MTEQTPAPDENDPFPEYPDVPVEGHDPEDALKHDPAAEQ